MPRTILLTLIQCRWYTNFAWSCVEIRQAESRERRLPIIQKCSRRLPAHDGCCTFLTGFGKIVTSLVFSFLFSCPLLPASCSFITDSEIFPTLTRVSALYLSGPLFSFQLSSLSPAELGIDLLVFTTSPSAIPELGASCKDRQVDSNGSPSQCPRSSSTFHRSLSPPETYHITFRYQSKVKQQSGALMDQSMLRTRAELQEQALIL